jgi:hypothetical protein
MNRQNTPPILPTPPPKPIRSFQDYKNPPPVWKQDLLKGTFQTDKLHHLYDHLTQGHHLATDVFRWGPKKPCRILWLGDRYNLHNTLGV